MKTISGNEIVYSINVNDLQDVAKEVLERRLTDVEIALVRHSVGDYVDWHQAIENAINEHVSE